MTTTEKINIVFTVINAILMLAYVIATVFICIYNNKSARASKEQILESQKQFKQINSAQVMITFKSISFGVFGFVISNFGNDYAKNIKIKCSENIINASKNRIKESLEQLCQSTFVLAPKQEFTLLLVPSCIKNLFDYIVNFDVSYESGNDKINSKITIDLSQYAWASNQKPHSDKFIEETLRFENRILCEYKDLNKSLNKLNKNIKYSNNKLSNESIHFLRFIKKTL